MDNSFFHDYIFDSLKCKKIVEKLKLDSFSTVERNLFYTIMKHFKTHFIWLSIFRLFASLGLFFTPILQDLIVEKCKNLNGNEIKLNILGLSIIYISTLIIHSTLIRI